MKLLSSLLSAILFWKGGCPLRDGAWQRGGGGVTEMIKTSVTLFGDGP